MKKLLIMLISALTPTLYFGQDATPQQTPPPKQFTITKAEGLSPFIVVKTEGKTKEELYKKTIEWINKNYNKPSEVIKAQVENDYIRFQGIEKDLFCWDALKTFCSDIRYEIEISFKDGKYKFSVLRLEQYMKKYSSDYTRTIGGNWEELDLVKKSNWFYKKDGNMRGMYKDHLPKIPLYFNNLNKSLYDYLYNQNETAKSNDW